MHEQRQQLRRQLRSGSPSDDRSLLAHRCRCTDNGSSRCLSIILFVAAPLTISAGRPLVKLLFLKQVRTTRSAFMQWYLIDY